MVNRLLAAKAAVEAQDELGWGSWSFQGLLDRYSELLKTIALANPCKNNLFGFADCSHRSTLEDKDKKSLVDRGH